ncbi:MAG: dTDP-4-dehydrorhamnose 3,5-epimerase family protein [Myxococcota bacterium]
MRPETSIDGVLVREVARHRDDRGWLAELFRQDELPAEFHPVMSYLSMTHPGVTRGPHEHRDQADLFVFLGPSRFQIFLWDNRPDSRSYKHHDRFEAGDSNPLLVLVPKGVVHAYRNVGSEEGLVINCPNRLYAGPGKAEPVDEIRHEEDPDGPFRIE